MMMMIFFINKYYCCFFIWLHNIRSVWKLLVLDRRTWNYITVQTFSIKYSCMKIQLNPKDSHKFFVKLYLFPSLKRQSLALNNATRVVILYGGVDCVMVIIAGNGHSDPISNPGWCWLHFPLRKVCIQLFSHPHPHRPMGK